MLLTVRPVVFRRRPVLEAMMPLPTPEITPVLSHHQLLSPTIDRTAGLTSRDQNVLHHAPAALVRSVEGWNWRRRQKMQENARRRR